ncbi:hypothetical protein ACVW0V_007126 [Bradyrhizobium elkanii]
MLPAAAMRPHLQHRVLHDVLGVGGVADDAQRDRVGAIDMTFDQSTKRRLVAGSKAVEQFLVFVVDLDGVERARIGNGGDVAPRSSRFGRRNRGRRGLHFGRCSHIKRVTHPPLSNQRRWHTFHAASER